MNTRPRRAVRKAIGITRHDVFMIVISVIGVTALFIAVLATFQLGEQKRHDEEASLARDIASCERGNEFRQLFRDIADAGEALDRGMLSVVFRPGLEDPARRDMALQILHELEVQAFDPYEAQVSEIRTVDCEQVSAIGR